MGELIFMGDDEQQDTEYGTTILEPFTLIPFDKIESGEVKLAPTPRKYLASARKAFYSAQIATSRTLTKQPPFTTGKRAGDPRPDLDVVHTWINGRTKGAAWFVAHFADGRFVTAEVWDPAGVEVEMRYDYSPNALDLKRRRDEPEKPFQRRVKALMTQARENDRLFNDGATYTINRRYINTSTDFEQWLARYDQTFVPRKPSARRKAAE